MLISKLVLSLIALGVGGTGLALAWQARLHSALRSEVDRTSSSATQQIRSLEQEVAIQSKQLDEAETRVSSLLQAAKTVTATPPQSSVSRNSDTPLDASEAAKLAIEQGRNLVKEGKSQDALALYVKVFREVRSLRPGGAANQQLMGALQHLGRTFPTALAALAQLRDEAMTQLESQSGKRDELRFEIALLNERLGQGERTLALFDALPPGDHQRASLAMVAREAFIKARRYPDALLGKAAGQMMTVVDSSAQILASQTDPTRQAMIRQAIVDQTLVNIEVLAGAGRSDESRQLTEKLLAFDSSEATRTRLDQHLARAKEASR